MMFTRNGLTSMLYFIISFLSLLAVQVLGTSDGFPTWCKNAPTSPFWPSPATWDQLNKTIGGQLVAPIPPGSVCHLGMPSYNETACWVAQLSWSDEFFHSRDPISSEWNNWNNDSCLPETDAPCSTAGYPLYVINATTTQHVKAGVDFARTHNIRLIVKNSGHDYVGRSSAGNSLSIWVHHMKGYQIHETSFSPQNCKFTIDGAAITAGAGMQMLETYEATAKVNHTVVGGNGRTVALGGFLTGAGHSILSPHFGLASDQVLEMEIVTPMGDILILNECQNTDLFWAMRGGGGSTFGILTSVTMKMFPSPSILNLSFMLSYPANDTHAFDAIAYFVSNFPSLADSGVSGYPILFNSVPSADGKSLISGLTGIVLMLNTTNSTDMMSLIQPLIDHANSTWPGFTLELNATAYPSQIAWYADNYDGSPVGYENIMGSRLLDKKALTTNVTAVKVALEKFSAGGYATVFIVSGKGVHDAVPRGGSNAILPAWRSTYVHATANIAFKALNSTAEQDAIVKTVEWAQALRDLAPDMGAYVNEGSGRYEPDWQASFWGVNYPRLLAIKRAVDPGDVFWCAPCVGNDRWEEVDGLLCRVDGDDR